MKSTNTSFLKKTLCAFIISLLITIPVFATWATTITEADVKLWKMWINLAIDGYAEQMTLNRPGEKLWWNVWY